MSAAVMVLAAGQTAVQSYAPLLVAVIGVVGSWFVARTTLRAARENNVVALVKADDARDQAIDQRVDQVNAALWARLDSMEERHRAVCEQRDQAREQLHRLRLAVIALGHDPDALVPPARSADPPAGISL